MLLDCEHKKYKFYGTGTAELNSRDVVGSDGKNYRCNSIFSDLGIEFHLHKLTVKDDAPGEDDVLTAA